MTMTLPYHLCVCVCVLEQVCVLVGLNGFFPRTQISLYLKCKMPSLQILIQILQQIDDHTL